MFRNFLKAAFRNLARQKLISCINIFGLAVGIACFSLFLLYAVNELSYDRFHRDAANIFRVFVWHEAKGNEAARGDTYQPMPLGPAMKRDLPGVSAFVRFRESNSENFFKVDGKVTRGKLAYADPSFFSVFSFPLNSGTPATALRDLHSLVLTESAASDLFGAASPVGKTIQIKTDSAFEPFTVTAVAADPPSNSSIRFSILANFNYLATTPSGKRRVNNWHQWSYQTFVQLEPGSRLPADRNALLGFRKKYYPDEDANARRDGWKGKGPRSYFGMQPLTAMHTDPLVTGGSTAPVERSTIWILMALATGVLIIACINFTTLSIGRSAGRSKEVGIRKVIGGSRASLIRQFLAEALLLVSVSTVLGLILARIFLPWFNTLSGEELHFSFTQFPQLTGWLALLLVFTGLLSGSYPAFVLSGFNPVRVLKTTVKLSGANVFTRTLVTVQFVLSAALIISTTIMIRQLVFLRSKNPGYNKDNVIVVDAGGIARPKKVYNLFKQQLASHPGIIGTASAELSFGGNQGWSQSMFRYHGVDKSVYEYSIDPDYLSVLGLQLMAGRNFAPGVAADTVNSVIINETMMNNFGWTPQGALGQKLSGYFDDVADPRTPVVIGVIKDFNFLSFSTAVEPQMFQQFAGYQPQKYVVRIGPGDPSKALAAIGAAWKTVAPDYPLKYTFLDEDLDLFYRSESKWSNIVASAGTVAILLACLGLFGLAALSAINRTKEIGIRKVLGASFAAILHLMSKDLLRLVLLAFLIATPLAWYVMKNWLTGYAYRIDIDGWVFVATGASTYAIAFAVVFSQSLKTIITNPVKSLRSE